MPFPFFVQELAKRIREDKLIDYEEKNKMIDIILNCDISTERKQTAIIDLLCSEIIRELLKKLSKYLREKKDFSSSRHLKKYFLEELADIYIVLEELRRFHGIKNEYIDLVYKHGIEIKFYKWEDF